MKKYNLLMVTLLVAAVVLSACSGAATQAPAQATTVAGKATAGPATAYVPPTTGQQKPPAVSEAYPATAAGGVQVVVGDGKAKVVEASAVKALAKAKASVNGKDLDLRKLGDLLKTAGISTFKSLMVVGRNGRTQLNADQAGKAYLDVAEDGTIKLAIDGVTPDRWITGVMQVNVEQ